MMAELDFVANPDAITRESPCNYHIQGLAETLLYICLKANLNEKDTRTAFEQAIERLFSKS